MGQFITKVKVVCDFDNSIDKNFQFTIVTDGTEKDVTDTVNAALRQKLAEGELESQNLRGIRIESNDQTGFFNNFVVKNISGFLGSL